MKKKKIFIMIAILILLAIYIYYRNPISEDKAKYIAINDINSDNVIVNKITLKNNKYKIELRDDNYYYTYIINSRFSKIISKSKEKKEDALKYIKDNEILKIVLKHANLKLNKIVLIGNSVELLDDIPIYTTIFNYNNKRYTYTTNGLTGVIMSVVNTNKNAS